MPRKPTYVVIVYRAGRPCGIVGYGGFWRMLWQSMALVCQCRWPIGVKRDLPDEVNLLLDDVMDPEHPPTVMH